MLLHFASGWALPPEPDTGGSTGPEGLCVLLHGRSGVGKRTIARAAADVLGLHVLEMGGDEVAASTAAETGKALEAVLERGAECAPCMVLLPQLEHLVTEEERKPNGEVGLRWEAKLGRLPPGVVVVAASDALDDLTVRVSPPLLYLA